jgi:hypothetical protein
MEDSNENGMRIQSTHTGPIARPIEEVNELDDLYGNKPTNDISNIKEAFPTLGGGATPAPNRISNHNPVLRPKNALNVKKGKKKGKGKKNKGSSNQNFAG